MGDMDLGNITGRLQAATQGRMMEKAVSAVEGADKNEIENKKMAAACREFESLFVYQMLKEMRATVPKTGLFDGGKAEEVYTSMLDEQLSREFSKGRGVGLSGLLLHQLNQVNTHREHNEK